MGVRTARVMVIVTWVLTGLTVCVLALGFIADLSGGRGPSASLLGSGIAVIAVALLAISASTRALSAARRRAEAREDHDEQPPSS